MSKESLCFLGHLHHFVVAIDHFVVVIVVVVVVVVGWVGQPACDVCVGVGDGMNVASDGSRVSRRSPP